MELPEVIKTLLDAKKAKGLRFADLESAIGRDAVWLAALFYRQASASEEEAQKLVKALGLGPDVAQVAVTRAAPEDKMEITKCESCRSTGSTVDLA